jgi:predicted TIM-barrel fold metal-dependent hydrolase
MSEAFIVDSHVHTGYTNQFFSPEVDAKSLLARMDQFLVRSSINLSSMRALMGDTLQEMEIEQREYEESEGRLFYCGFYNPRRGKDDLAALEKASRWTGMKGIKIHPSFAGVAADDPRYEPVWRFATEHRLPIVSHTWSVSSYNPSQALSTPNRFEPMVEKFPSVRFILAHSGGKGTGRREAVRMASTYPGVYMDCAGDIHDRHYFESMAAAGIERKVLFGTDYPWIDIRSHLAAVQLARISSQAKLRIMRENAVEVFRLEETGSRP